MNTTASPAQEAAEREAAAAEAAGRANVPPASPKPSEEPGATIGKERAAVEKAGSGQDLTGGEEADATAWYLDPAIDEQEPSTLELTLNRAPVGKPKQKVKWIVRDVGRARIKQIRRDALNSRTGEEDEMLVNLTLAVEGTVYPDLTSPGVRGQYADPADALQLRLFKHKQGLIDQVANKVMAISGYDDDDVEEVEAGKH